MKKVRTVTGAAIRCLAALLLLAVIAEASAQAGVWDFESDPVGTQPKGFDFAVTGNKKPGRWQIAQDGENRVLAQLDRDKTARRFAMALVHGMTYKDLSLSVRAKPIAGDVEMVAGLVWRYQDPDNYYVARWNSDTLRVDRVVNGERLLMTPAEIKTSLAADQWHTLAIEHRDDRIEVRVDGVHLFSGVDRTFQTAGKFGVWIKADSITYFDDLRVEPGAK